MIACWARSCSGNHAWWLTKGLGIAQVKCSSGSSSSFVLTSMLTVCQGSGVVYGKTYTQCASSHGCSFTAQHSVNCAARGTAFNETMDKKNRGADADQQKHIVPHACL